MRDNGRSLFEEVLTQNLLVLSFVCLVTGERDYLACMFPDCTPFAKADFFSLQSYIMSTSLCNFLIYRNHIDLSFIL